ncbi:MAG TPA: hypothetical protein VFA26_19350 [Gemmataceae bacterium]|nr:hypothetical protein [Gemmataceae bacterium]
MVRSERWAVEPAPVRGHLDALRISSELTSYFRRKHQPGAAMITPEAVIAALHGAGVRCVLMGTHGVGGYRSEPRATQDVNVLVTKRDIRKAVRALREAYPGLTVKDSLVVTRFIDPATGKPVIDVMKPTQPVYRIVFRHTIAVGQTHRIPNLEMALASKFAAMVSPNRDPAKKMIDAGDFIDVVRHNRDDINVPKLRRLADKVYPDGGAEVLRMLEDIDAGRTIQL